MSEADKDLARRNGLQKFRHMTLRDYFAGQALCGMAPHADSKYLDELYAQRAYEIADAMLTARNNTVEGEG